MALKESFPLISDKLKNSTVNQKLIEILQKIETCVPTLNWHLEFPRTIQMQLKLTHSNVTSTYQGACEYTAPDLYAFSIGYMMYRLDLPRTFSTPENGTITCSLSIDTSAYECAFIIPCLMKYQKSYKHLVDADQVNIAVYPGVSSF